MVDQSSGRAEAITVKHLFNMKIIVRNINQKPEEVLWQKLLIKWKSKNKKQCTQQSHIYGQSSNGQR